MARTERITFPGSLGEDLAARLEWPEGAPRAFALFAHCFSCSKDILAATRIAQGFTAQGIAVLRFDFTGLGQSDGDFANTNFSSNVGDLLAAADWLRKTHKAPELLVGHSLGGAAVVIAAPKVPECRAVATLGAPADVAHVTQNFIEHVPEIEAKGEAQVKLGGRPFTIKRQFLEDLDTHQPRQVVQNLDRALLVMHAPLDTVVGIENATALFSGAKHPKSFVSLDTSDHLLSGKGDALYAAQVIAAWASRFLTSTDQAATGRIAPDHPVPDHTAQVTERTSGPFTADIRIGQWHLTGDQPAGSGGKGEGPSPYDYLAAALGLCTTQTLRLYIKRKGWDLGSVTASVTYDKRHRQDCEDCVDGKGVKALHLDVALHLPEGTDPEWHAKIVDIAHKCPVHKTLAEQQVPISVAIAS